MHRIRITFLLVLAWLCPKAATAADTANCSLKLVNTVPIVMADEGRRALVPVKVNGTEKEFLLDTGGAMTQISAAAAEELKLPIMDSDVKMLDLYGNASTKAARVGTFSLGRLSDRNTRLPLSTFFSDGGRVSGLLAADYMGRYDIELDFAGGKMNYFSTDHCPGKVVYWPAAAIAVVPILFGDMQHLVLDVSLDGHHLRAMIDTGAPGTTLYAAEAKRVFGITSDDPNKRFEQVFQKLSFEGLEVGNAHIQIIPDKTGSKDPNNGFVTGSRVRRVDDGDPTDPVMLIGMNILTKLHIYIAFDERKIYITPAAQPAPPQ